MSEKINSKTSLTKIKQHAEADFGAILTTEQAKAIKKAYRRNCMIWTKNGIITTDESQINIRPNWQ